MTGGRFAGIGSLDTFGGGSIPVWVNTSTTSTDKYASWTRYC